jgi:DNA repair exonuclease SbcCD ATPase subunit
VLLILTGLVYYYRQDIFNNQKSEPEQIKKADKIVEKVNKLVSDNETLKRKNNGLNSDKKVLEQERDRLISEKSGLLNEGRQKSEAISRLEISDTEQKTKIAEDEQTIKDLSDHLKLLSEPDRLLRQNQDLFNQLKQGERDIQQELSDQLDREKQDKQRLFEQTQAQSNENSLSEQLNQKEQEKLALFTQTQYQIEAIDRLTARNNDKANEITQLKINNEAQSREITRLKNENKTQSDMIQAYENLSQQNKTLLAEIERLKQALREAEKNKA